MPTFAAAPSGPAITQFDARSARRMCSRPASSSVFSRDLSDAWRASSQLAASSGIPFYSEATGVITAALRAPAKMFDEYSATGQTTLAPITLSTKATFIMLRSAKPSKA